MRKIRKFEGVVLGYLNNFDTVDVKAAIGDSTNNTRTLSVNQVIRFLRTKRKTSLANSFEALYSHPETREALQEFRTYKRRNDAYGINELSIVLEAVEFSSTAVQEINGYL